MQCARCRCELEQIDFKNITVNECPECHGWWFDRGELQKAKDNTDEDLRWINFDPFTKKGNRFNRVSVAAGACPKCSQPMTTLTYANSGVEIEKCERCRGVWLKHGEFKKIIAYLEDLVVSHSASEYVIDSIKQLLDIVTGSEEKISEVKDFLVVLKLLKLRAAVEHSKIAAVTNKIYEYLPFL